MAARHPRGLPILFFTEMWERFSYYGMRAILVLYLTHTTTGDNPGMGWSDAGALELYGWYTMMVYLMSLPGGWLADRLLGQKKTVLVGGVLIAAGQFCLAAGAAAAFYAGLILLVTGVGCLKPNVSTMVGGLYGEGDPMRDKGFTIFYIGINIGAFSSPLIVGYIGEVYGWHYGFGLAGIGMLLGLIVYLLGRRHLAEVGIGEVALVGGEPTLLISFIIVLVFWAAYEQAGGLMNLYTQDKINRVVLGYEIPTSVFQSVPALFVIIFGTPVMNFWGRRYAKGKESSSLFKMAVGTIVMGTGFLLMSGAALQAAGGEKAMLIWLVGAYLMHVLGELSISPVALSFITKLAPVKYASLMMGVYFAATGLGNKAAGMLGELATKAGELQVFTGIFVFCVVFGVLLLVFFKKLKALTHGAEDLKTA